MTEMDHAAQALAQFPWSRKAQKEFLRSAGVDYLKIRARVNDQLWDALLQGLPRMAERGDMNQAWFAYRMIAARRLGNLRPRAEVLEKLRDLTPQGGRALWRISVAEDPKHPVYKSTLFLNLRRQARRELCNRLCIPITKELVKAPGRGFTRLLLTAIAAVRPSFSPEQAVILAAWADRERGMLFLARGLKKGIFRISEGASVVRKAPY